MPDTLLGRLGAVVAQVVPDHVAVNYHVILSDGLKARTINLYQPDGGDINAITDETLAQVLRDELAKLEAM